MGASHPLFLKPLILCGVLLCGCARHLASVDARTVSKVIDVPGVAAATAYSRAAAWFASQDRAGIHLSSNDPGAATILASADMQCSSSVGAGLRAMGLGFNQNYLRSVIQFQAKDGRFRLSFTDLFYYVTDIRYAGSALAQGPANQAEVDALYRDCLQGSEASLVQAVTGRVGQADF